MTASPTLRPVAHPASPAPAAIARPAPAEGEPSLAVVLGTRNRLAHLKNCLDSLLGQVNVAHEIIVADAGSTDGTLEYLQGLPGVRLVLDGELRGQAHSLNMVFRQLTTKYTCWLSDDNVVMSGVLDLAVSILEQHPDFGMVALKVRDVEGPSQHKQYMGAISPTGVLNCNHGVIRTALLEQVGYLDERNKGYGFDPDLTMKVLLAGYKVAHTRRVAIHHHNDNVASPGAVAQSEREKRLATSRALYCETYQDWIVPVSAWRRTLEQTLRLYLIYPVYGVARRLGWPLEERLGYNPRDWTNLQFCRYVSRLDFWQNRRHPYYLVQSIPLGERQRRAKAAS
jgi:GT2 family glycosyltransferase